MGPVPRKFAVLLLVIFIVELAVGIAAAVNKNEVNSVLKTALRNSLGNSTHSSDVDRKAWDEMQMKVGRGVCLLGVENWLDWENVSIPLPAACCPDTISEYPSYVLTRFLVCAENWLDWENLKCCGVENWRDWDNVSVPLPASCCPDPPAQPLKQICATPATVYSVGCYDTLKTKVKDGAIVIMGVGIGLAFIQFIGIVFAFCLASAIKRGEEK
uniref:Tetraspanin n=1 Tax=Timema californicum TaxID=61474 RepID=A0A7R9JH99_TIMCA|nr:unnamed protein product [Timema californicum]